jgi:purine nucleosidase
VERETRISVLDTDIGTDVDDILALTLMARTPEFNLAGVATVYGNTELRARMARYVLQQLDREDVAVAAGSSETLAGEPVWWGGHEGEGIPGLGRIEVTEARDGVTLLCDLARKHAGALEVFAIGPLTNIAKAIQADPSFAGSVRHLYIMGGAYWKDQPEHNIKSDAPAAHVVFSSGIPITVCGLDVTNRVWLREDGVEEIRRGLGDFGEILAEQFWRWLDFMVEHGISDGTIKGTHLHDPLAVLAAIEPDVLTFERCDVAVDLAGDSIGRTRLENCGSGRIRVASDVDVERAERALLDRIAGLRRADGPPDTIEDAGIVMRGIGE